MRLDDFYRKAVACGMANDLRGAEAVQRDLDDARKRFDKASEDDKAYFDPETLTNPYADTRILRGDGDVEFGSVLVGVDIDVGELLLADRLREKGRAVDLVLGHHPSGPALARLGDVMGLQVDVLADLGVPLHIAEDLMDDRSKEVGRKLLPNNHTRAQDAARLLDMPFMCAHTVADNMVATYLQRLLDEKQPHRVEEILETLLEQPEYRDGKKSGFGPTVLVGSKERRAGKIFVDMTGGTSPHKDLIRHLAENGVSTLVGMHMSDDHRKQAQEHHLNVLIAGHIPSDNLGLNLLLDATLDDGIEIIECSGFRRVERR